MRVLFLVRSLEVGGAERQLVLLARGLKRRGHQTGVAVFYGGGDLERGLQRDGVPLYDLQKSGRWESLGFARRLRSLVRRTRPQVLYSFLDTPNLAAAWLRPFLPGVRVVWGLRASDMDLSRYSAFARFAHRLLPASARLADLVVSNSQAGVAHWQRLGVDPEKMRCVPNGIDADRFTPDAAARERVRAQWGVGEGELLVGNVARLDPAKDQVNFLEAGARVLAQEPAARLVHVGGGDPDLGRRLERRAEELGLAGRILWAGQSEDVPAVMNALDLLVLSSAFGEGFPNVVGEAMACALPCVVTDVGDAAAVVGDAAVVAPRRDPQALAGRIARVLGLAPAERAVMGRRLRARVEEQFSVEAMLARTEEALEEALGRRGGGP